MQPTIEPTRSDLRAIKVRAAVEVLGGIGLIALLALLIYAPSLIFGGNPLNDGHPLVVLARCASAR